MKMCLQVYSEQSITNYRWGPSHLSSTDTECSWSHPGLKWRVSRHAWRRRNWISSYWRNTRRLICICGMIILKWILKKLVLFLDSILHNNTGKAEFLEKLMRLFCINFKKLKNFATESFWGRIKINDFSCSIISNISKLPKSYRMLTKKNRIIINTKLITRCWIKKFHCNLVIS